jgi:glycogen operon protein
MILMGDEIGRTQQGNNNAYCHDTDLSWLDWALLETNADLFRFFKHYIAFRRAHPVLRNRTHLRNQDYVGSGYPDISWHGVRAWHPDWSGYNLTLAFMLCGKHAHNGRTQDNNIYVVMNMHWEAHQFEIPQLPQDVQWHVFANTSATPPEDIWEPGREPRLTDQQQFLVGPRSVVILVGK